VPLFEVHVWNNFFWTFIHSVFFFFFSWVVTILFWLKWKGKPLTMRQSFVCRR
jgi:hypothetical protein